MQVNTYVPSKQTQESSFRLQEGGIYRARILERSNSNEAVLGLRGSKMKASFEGSMPKQNQVAFEVTGKKDGTLQIKAMDISSNNNGSGKAAGANSILKNLGIQQPSTAMTNAAKIMLDTGSPLTKETAESMQRFIEQSNGMREQKLNTIRTAATKGIQVNDENLKHVHEGLNNKNVVDVVNNLSSKSGSVNNTDISRVVEKALKAADADSSQSLKDAVKDIQQRINNGASVEEVTEAVKKRVMNHSELSKEEAARLEKAVKEAELLTSTGKERLNRALQSIVNKENTASFSKSSDLLQMIQQVRSNGGSNEAIQQQVKQLLDANGVEGENEQRILKLVKQLDQLDQSGKQRLINTLEQTMSEKGTVSNQSSPMQNVISSFQNQLNTEPDLEKVMNHLQQQISQAMPDSVQNVALEKIDQAKALLNEGKEMAARQVVHQSLQEVAEAAPKNEAVSMAGAQYSTNEQIQTSPSVESKQMLETRITDRMIKVTDDFKQMKQSTVKQLEQTEKIMNQDKQSAPQAKQVLEAVIKKMDRAILRSDFMLFTDMKTERQMLQASSQLTEAKQLLSKGQTSAALNIVKDVQQSMEQLDFNPSEQKVKNVITREESFSMDKGVKAASQQVADQSKMVAQDPSSRQLFELVRSLGLNRESEIGQMLTSSQTGQQQGQSGSQQNNMKEALLQLLKNEDEGSRMQQKINQSVSNLTGQQLMNKSEQGNNMQHLLFNLPVPMKDKHEQLQVYVQSRQEADQLDWENCNLYFLIDTPSLGETGIMVQSTERQLSITLKNDDPAFQDMMEPLVEQTTEAISDIGYNINDIHYQPMNRAAEKIDEEQKTEEEPDLGFVPFYTEKGFDFKI
ncbi:hypothetical protein D7Z54_17585 [Salibacterium salarium]|uniref:Hook-length control protein FliK n=1 Tax=Salibacterium salarium TaxID=284579 RepID=A0A3R9QJC5_9BACI|nr:hypothetical protein [Salibacterium salarium]RSL32012.1 hypothetical protein D7Z54_17585 [Salibacterium salarium]